jgi:alkylation response protein AidB-like acyl-CoA dehydrogenase
MVLLVKLMLLWQLQIKQKAKKGISAFILEKGMEGFIIGKKENKLGMRASDTTQLNF